jgi:hypothetical protein
MVIRFLRTRSQPRSSVKFTAMRRTILILFTVAGLSSQEAFAGDCDARSSCRKFSIYQAAPTYGPHHGLSPSDQLLVQSSAAMGSITAQSTVHIPAFSVPVRVLWNLQGRWARGETLQRDFLTTWVSLSVLAPVVSKIIKSELRSSGGFSFGRLCDAPSLFMAPLRHGQRTLRMSAYRGRPEVIGAKSERRD